MNHRDAASRHCSATPGAGRTRGLWSVILAGGEGKRLSALTEALYGAPIPKQFAVLAGHLSLLQTTVERASQLAPLERIVVVVSSPHESLAREQLARYPGVRLLIQPRNLDTGPGILVPVAFILARDPQARVAILPSDHYLRRAEPFLDAIEAASAAAVRDSQRVTLVSAVPDSPEADYGWIVPGKAIDRARGTPVRAVDRFVEKPSSQVAHRLFEAGGLWNTFASAGTAAAYWALARRYLPAHAALFESHGALAQPMLSDAVIRRIYTNMPPANFSREVFQSAAGLAVVSVAGSGWSDWGSPERVLRSLAGGPELPALLARLRIRTDAGPAAASAKEPGASYCSVNPSIHSPHRGPSASAIERSLA